MTSHESLILLTYFSSPLVYLTAKTKARTKQFDWMQPELYIRCTNRDARTEKTFISNCKWQVLSRWKIISFA